MAASDAKQHAPALDPKGEVARAMDVAADLCLVEDPPEEPFRSKYKARDLLIKAKQSHAREAKGEGSTPSLTLIDYRLGVIALAVEENSKAQEALDTCAVAFFEGVVGKIATAAGKEEDEDGSDGRTKGGAGKKPSPPPVPTEAPPGMVVPCPLAWQHPEEAADTLTQLGLLWAARGYPRRSLFYLLASVGFLKEASSSAGDDGTAEEGGESAGKAGEELEKEAGTEEGGDAAGVPGTRVGGTEERKEKLESLLTHALYYLAQAYGTQDAEQSAKYCAITLQRQLDASQRGEGKEVSFNPGEWSRNACFLATYYGGQDQPLAAGRCLLAAQSVLAKPMGGQANSTVGKTDDSKSAAAAPMPPLPPPPSAVPSAEGPVSSIGDAKGKAPSPAGEGGSEPEAKMEGEQDEEGEERRERRADVDRHLANLYISVLEARHSESTAPLGGFDPIGKVPPPGASPVPPGKRPGGEGEEERREREEEEKLGFVSLGLGNLLLCDPSQVGGDFDSIREVFMLAKRYTDRALQYYVLDGYVTAHVALQQGLSRAYRCLTTYEPGMKRREAMFKRRAQILDPLLKVLAVKAYLRLHKELSFELGEIYQEMARVKLGRLNDTENVVKNEKSSLRAITTMYETSLGLFAHFIKLYHENDETEGAPDSSAQPDKSIDSEEVQGYLMARFMRARLNARLTPSCMKKKLAYTILSLAEFSWIEEHAFNLLSAVREKNPGAFDAEMEMVKDYVRMQRGNKERISAAIQEEEDAGYF